MALLDKVLADAATALAALTVEADRATELVDQLPSLAAGMSLENHATLAITLKDARDAVSRAKTRLTNAQQNCDRWFALRIQEGTGQITYRTEKHTFTATAKAHCSTPSQNNSPVEFKRLVEWLKENAPDVKVEQDHTGKFSIEGLEEHCDALLADGKRLPPGVSAFIVDAVTIRRKQ